MSAQMSKEPAEQLVERIEMPDLGREPNVGKKKITENAMDMIRNVRVRLQVSAGNCEITVRELLEFKEGTVLALDKSTGDPMDILVDGKIVARGMLVAVGDNFGVRITEVFPV